MKIVNNAGSNTDNILNGSMFFEAELYHRGINPKISFFKDVNGSINLSFSNWDTKEAIDSYTPDQAEEMIHTLVEAINFARHYDDGASLFDNTEENSNAEQKQSGGVEEGARV